MERIISTTIISWLGLAWIGLDGIVKGLNKLETNPSGLVLSR
jgi:hypothetical protein